jgi:hypothetical protein
MLVVAMLFWLVPPATLMASAFAGEDAGLGPAALLATVLSTVFWMLICYGMGIPAIYGMGYPIGTVTALYIALRSTWRGSRKVEWRGRVYGRRGSGAAGQRGSKRQ